MTDDDFNMQKEGTTNMSIERKVQDTSWWITSIAISVVCCSILFLLFASYMVDIKNDLRNEKAELTAMTSSIDTLTARVVLLQKTVTPVNAPVPVAAAVAPDASAPGVDLSSAPVTTPPVVSTPTLAPPATLSGGTSGTPSTTTTP